MKIVTAEMMRALDQRAMEEGGIPGAVLMENAGHAVFMRLAERFGPLHGRVFVVLCGTGNNGGDGFVIARYLKLSGASVAVRLVGDPQRLKGDARLHYELMLRAGVEPQEELPASAIRVDALLGTGVQGAPREDYAEAIRWINAENQPIIAVDIPSGVDSDTGATPGEAVRADLTVTFGYPKLGLLLAPGADCAGEVVVDPIGFPWESLSPETPYRWIRREWAQAALPPRPREAHKGLLGHVLVVGGSRGMSGAPTMAAKAAMRTGAGLVTVAAPESAQWIIASKVDEAMTVPLPEEDGALCEASIEPLRAIAGKCDVLCVGPGSTQKPAAQSLLLRVVNEIAKPMALDADGLNALARFPEALNGRTAPLILTPHPGECARLLDIETREVQADRVAAVRQAARKYRCIVVLKGARSLVCDGRAGTDANRLPVAVNTTGNPGMATGGSGDTLTGIIGALLGQGLEPFDAACIGVYLHGRAGDIAANERNEVGMVAGDIAEALPQAIREIVV